MGKISYWLFRELFPLKAQELDLLRVTKVDLIEKHDKMEQACGELMAIARRADARADVFADHLAGKELELATLKNKIVERAQVPPILRAKSSADVRRIVEQANEAEFEEQANAPFRS